MAAPKGMDVVLECLAEASPKAINYWTRENGKLISLPSSFKKTKENNISSRYQSDRVHFGQNSKHISVKSCMKNFFNAIPPDLESTIQKII